MTAAVWHRRDDVLWRRLEAGLLLLPAEAATPVLLDGAAPVIWELLAAPTAFDEAVDVLAEVFNVAATDIEGDLDAFLATLRDMGAAACR